MPRQVRDSRLESRAARAKLEVRHKPFYRALAPGLHIGLRKSASAGQWVVRHRTGTAYAVKNLGARADDHEVSNGHDVLTYAEAVERARTVARAGAPDQVVTVAKALDAYEADLMARGSDPYNARRVRPHMPAALAARPVGALTIGELEAWRDGLPGTKATVNRTSRMLGAALRHAAERDEAITNHGAWRVGLKALRGAAQPRHVILADADIGRLVQVSHTESPEFAALVEVLAVTGARVSQAARLTCADVGPDTLDMPSSAKGRGEKAARTQVPVAPDLARRLRTLASGRLDTAPLLRKPSGEPWRNTYIRPFKRAVERAGLDSNVTAYALRHSSITRQLLANVPIRIVAKLHDTSVTMIEKTYSVGIDKHSDAIVRPALLKL